MFRLLATTVLLAACGRAEHGTQTPFQPLPLALTSERPTNETVADYRGYEKIDALIKDRMIAPSAEFVLARYLEDLDSGGQAQDLTRLLGFSFGDGQHSEFRNGKPNAMNLVLWHMTLSGLAQDLAVSCNGTAAEHAVPNDRLANAMLPLCKDGAKDKASFKPLWTAVLATDAPDSEREAFEDFFYGPAYTGKSGPVTLATMLTAMLYNPHFLVQK